MAIPWAAKRQIAVFSIFALITLLILSGVIYFLVKKVFVASRNPSSGSTENLSIIWTRVFPLSSGFIDAAALLENPNHAFGAHAFRYAFKIYDAHAVLIAIKENETMINPGETFMVFEPNIPIQNRVAVKAILEIRSLSWEAFPPSSLLQMDILRKDQFLDDVVPRVEVVVKNQSNARYKKIEATLVLFSSAGDAVAVSRTIMDALEGGEEKKLIFTWPQKISGALDAKVFFRPLP